MKTLIRVSVALTWRAIYMLFSLLCMYRVRINTDNKFFWAMMLSMLFLMVETAAIVWVRIGKEFRGFQPSILFFLCCVLPVIWILGLEESYKRTNFKQLADNQDDKIKELFASSSSLSLTSNLSNLTESNKAIAFECCDSINLSHWVQQEYFNLESNIIIQILLIILILSRFLTTHANLTLNQRIIFLVISFFISMDIIEFFSYVNFENIFDNDHFVHLILFICTFSMIQFIYFNTDQININDFVIKSKTKFIDNDSLMKRNYNMLRKKLKPFHVSFVSNKQLDRAEQIISTKQECCLGCGIAAKAKTYTENNNKLSKSNESVFIIMLSILLHDLTFLAFRLFLCFKFSRIIQNSNIIFYMAKNFVLIIVQVYKIFSINKMKKIQRNNDLIINSRLEYINNNRIKQLSSNPYRFAQVYAATEEELDMSRKRPIKSNLKSNYFDKRNYEYQQQQHQHDQINEFSLAQLTGNFGNPNSDSAFGINYLNNNDKSDDETNVTLM